MFEANYSVIKNQILLKRDCQWGLKSENSYVISSNLFSILTDVMNVLLKNNWIVSKPLTEMSKYFNLA